MPAEAFAGPALVHDGGTDGPGDSPV